MTKERAQEKGLAAGEAAAEYKNSMRGGVQARARSPGCSEPCLG